MGYGETVKATYFLSKISSGFFMPIYTERELGFP